jgi:hypothetical protein
VGDGHPPAPSGLTDCLTRNGDGQQLLWKLLRVALPDAGGKMKHLLFTLFMIAAVLVAPPPASAQSWPPSPAPEDCGIDPADCQSTFDHCMLECEGKSGNYFTCYYSICNDEYWGCVYGGLSEYWQVTTTSTLVRYCVHAGDTPLTANRDTIVERTTLYRRQECPNNGPVYTIVLSDTEEVTFDCFHLVSAYGCTEGDPIYNNPSCWY